MNKALRLIIAVSVIIALVKACSFIGGTPGRYAMKIAPGTPYETVVKLLGEPTGEIERMGMTVYLFKPNFMASGQIRVGFDSQMRAIYMKIWEDAPPQWNLTETNAAEPAPPAGRGEAPRP
jgi:hypothetical protein